MLPKILVSDEDKNKIDEIFSYLKSIYLHRKDPWGFDIEAYQQVFELFLPLYRKYFKVRVFGTENIPKDRPIIGIANHSGQLPIDQVLINMAFCLELEQPRILRGLVNERWSSLPFLANLTQQLGLVMEDYRNGSYLLSKGESIISFPEGSKGFFKSTANFYQLQTFKLSIFRMALEHEVDIVPICVIGAEEMYPFVFQINKFANLIKVPLNPLVGPLGLLPLPSPVDIYISTPYSLHKNLPKDATDKMLVEHVLTLQEQMRKTIYRGLIRRRPFFDSIRLPLTDLIRQKHKGNIKK